MSCRWVYLSANSQQIAFSSTMTKRRLLWLSAATFLLVALLGGWWFLFGSGGKSLRTHATFRILWLKATGELPHVSWSRMYAGATAKLRRHFNWLTEEDDPRSSARDAGVGGDLFLTHCATCHGDAGEGGAGPGLRQVGNPSRASDAALFDIISEGIPGKMPAASLSKQEVSLASGYLRWKTTPDASSGGQRQPGKIGIDPPK